MSHAMCCMFLAKWAVIVCLITNLLNEFLGLINSLSLNCHILFRYLNGVIYLLNISVHN